MKIESCVMRLGPYSVHLNAWEQMGIPMISVYVANILIAHHQLNRTGNAGVAEWLYRNYVGGLGDPVTEREIDSVLKLMC